MISTRISLALNRVAAGEEAQRSELFDALREELHQIASSHLRRERTDHTLQPTALVNEAWLKLADQNAVQGGGRMHFLSVASQAMRRILVDHARGRLRSKRGGGLERQDVHQITLASVEDGLAEYSLLALDDALTELATRSSRQARIIELRFFGGMTSAEVAETLDLSLSTVDREWKFARLWLLSVLE